MVELYSTGQPTHRREDIRKRLNSLQEEIAAANKTKKLVKGRSNSLSYSGICAGHSKTQCMIDSDIMGSESAEGVRGGSHGKGNVFCRLTDRAIARRRNRRR